MRIRAARAARHGAAGGVELALAAGFARERIVLDSPAKSRAEIREALTLGIALNADNLAELDRIEALRPARPWKPAGRFV
ncbi:hypothetical protein ACGFZH_22610 [Streptomyces zaomyceticus]|uniref:hypothetical protein n=1 Tax=Streptomyces zaomyceticus TaxID=68286 RepID=UPI00372109F9